MLEDEQPSPAIKEKVERVLAARDWEIDVVLSHTTPLRYEPVECFIPDIDQSKVDKSTEEWLGTIEAKLKYQHWYCGHYHILSHGAACGKCMVASRTA